MKAAVDGILIIDKPYGITSMDVVRRVKRGIGVKRVGHGGTLDPVATGVIAIDSDDVNAFSWNQTPVEGTGSIELDGDRVATQSSRCDIGLHDVARREQLPDMNGSNDDSAEHLGAFGHSGRRDLIRKADRNRSDVAGLHGVSRNERRAGNEVARVRDGVGALECPPQPHGRSRTKHPACDCTGTDAGASGQHATLLRSGAWQRRLACERRSGWGHNSNLGTRVSDTKRIIDTYSNRSNMSYTYCDIARDTDDWCGDAPPVPARALTLAARHRRTADG